MAGILVADGGRGLTKGDAKIQLIQCNQNPIKILNMFYIWLQLIDRLPAFRHSLDQRHFRLSTSRWDDVRRCSPRPVIQPVALVFHCWLKVLKIGSYHTQQTKIIRKENIQNLCQLSDNEVRHHLLELFTTGLQLQTILKTKSSFCWYKNLLAQTRDIATLNREINHETGAENWLTKHGTGDH